MEQEGEGVGKIIFIRLMLLSKKVVEFKEK